MFTCTSSTVREKWDKLWVCDDHVTVTNVVCKIQIELQVFDNCIAARMLESKTGFWTFGYTLSALPAGHEPDYTMVKQCRSTIFTNKMRAKAVVCTEFASSVLSWLWPGLCATPATYSIKLESEVI